MDTSLIVSHGVTFIFGIAVGAGGKYFADLFTDQRRRKEARKAADKEFRKLTASMPDLLAEMRDDVRRDPHTRKFYVGRDETMGTHHESAFTYAGHYLDKVKILEMSGHVVADFDRVPCFRMLESFVDKLRAWKPPEA